MRLSVTHDTRYDYQPAVATALHLIHLSPPNTPRQTVLDHRLDVHPAPTARSDSLDVYGNRRSVVEPNTSSSTPKPAASCTALV